MNQDKNILQNDNITSANKVDTYNNLVSNAATLLAAAGVPGATHDALELMLSASGQDKMWYVLHSRERATGDIQIKFEQMVLRRLNREPLQHIIGTAPFYGRDFIVSPAVLVPRFETEMLVEHIIKMAEREPFTNLATFKMLDLCTGSGCIGITLAIETKASVSCSDISAPALEVASANAAKHNANINFIQSDMFENINDKYDLIVSNPPYISKDEMKSLEPEVKNYDPHIALTDDGDGLKFYKIIASGALGHLNDGGHLILEIGCNQGCSVKEILQSHGFVNVEVHKDLAGLDRMITANI